MMNKKESDLKESILEKYGLNLCVIEKEPGDRRLSIYFRDENIERAESYYLTINADTARFNAEIGFESLAKKLLLMTIENIRSTHEYLQKYLSQVELRDISILINQSRIATDDIVSHLENVNEFAIRLISHPLDLSNQNYIDSELGKFLSKVIPLLILIFPYEEDYYGEIEGESFTATTTKYERSKKNRAICIAFHGINCNVCGMNLGKVYGDVAEGFIHVHHRNPISKVGVVKIDPVRDLIPICPNCHAVVHLVDPPLNIDTLRGLIEKGEGVGKI